MYRRQLTLEFGLEIIVHCVVENFLRSWVEECSSAIYIILDDFGVSLFLSNFIASLASVIYSGIMARVLKTPTTIFVALCIIPLVPGGSLFYTMSNLIMWNQTEFFRYGLNTILIALGIAGGIVVESATVHLMGRAITKARRQQTSPQETKKKS